MKLSRLIYTIILTLLLGSCNIKSKESYINKKHYILKGTVKNPLEDKILVIDSQSNLMEVVDTIYINMDGSFELIVHPDQANYLFYKNKFYQINSSKSQIEIN